MAFAADAATHLYYDRRAAEYDDWWTSSGRFGDLRARPGWQDEVDGLVELLRGLAPARTLDEGLARLSALSERFEATGDRRAVFADTYLIQIKAFAEDVAQPGRYAHPAWMTGMTLDFLQRYLDAVDEIWQELKRHVG